MTLKWVEGFSRLLSPFPSIETGMPIDSLQYNYHHRFCVKTWQLLPTYVGPLRLWLESVGVKDDTFKSLEDRATALSLYGLLRHKVLNEIVRSFDDSSIQYCLLKGTALSVSEYASPSDRVGIDVDICIKPYAAATAREIVAKLGFVQSAWDPDQRVFVEATIAQRRWIDENHYELGFLVRRNTVEGISTEDFASVCRQLEFQPNPWFLENSQLSVWINVDLHIGLSHDIGVEEVIRDSEEVTSKGVNYRVPSRPWLLFHVVYKIYWEGVHAYEKGLYQYADLTRVLQRTSDIECQKFLQLVELYSLEAAAFFVLRRIEPHFGVKLPAVLQDFVERAEAPREGANPHQENNSGDMWSKIWGFR